MVRRQFFGVDPLFQKRHQQDIAQLPLQQLAQHRRQGLESVRFGENAVGHQGMDKMCIKICKAKTGMGTRSTIIVMTSLRLLPLFEALKNLDDQCAEESLHQHALIVYEL